MCFEIFLAALFDAFCNPAHQMCMRGKQRECGSELRDAELYIVAKRFKQRERRQGATYSLPVEITLGLTAMLVDAGRSETQKTADAASALHPLWSVCLHFK